MRFHRLLCSAVRCRFTIAGSAGSEHRREGGGWPSPDEQYRRVVRPFQEPDEQEKRLFWDPHSDFVRRIMMEGEDRGSRMLVD